MCGSGLFYMDLEFGVLDIYLKFIYLNLFEFLKKSKTEVSSATDPITNAIIPLYIYIFVFLIITA